MERNDLDILWTVSLFANAIAIFIALFVGALFVKKQNDSKSGASIKMLFFVSLVLILFNQIFCMIAIILHFTAITLPVWTFVIFAEPVGGLFYLILLATLVLRLHITFKESTFRMTTRTIYMFFILFIVCIIAIICGSIGRGLQYSDSEQTAAISEYMGLVFMFLYWPLYFIGSIAAVRYFLGNLEKLAQLRATSLRDVTIKEEDISLNSTQQQMVNVSAKYILLFFVAIISTLSTIIVATILDNYPHLRAIYYMIWSFDFCVNFICLYLQFSFAAERYHKFCSCLDNVCRSMVSKRTRRVIHGESISRCEMPPSIHSGHMNVLSGSEIETLK